MRIGSWLVTGGMSLLLLLPVSPCSGQEAAPVQIQILEPADWASVPTRGLEVRARRSLRVSGLVSHSSGVGKVLLNGDEASLTREGDGSFRFTGFVRVEEGVSEVQVSAFPMVGPVSVRSFQLAPVPAGQGYEDPSDAWSGEGQGFSGERWAVVIGLGEYQDPRIPPLRFARQDAEAVRDFLQSESAGLGGFSPERVAVLLNEEATYRNIRSALFSFLRSATDDDIVLVYFAGHGAPDPGRLQDHYLLAYDTDLDDLPATALLMEDVSDAVRRLYFRHLVILADACHSGGVGGQTATRDLSLNTVNSAFLNRMEASIGGQVTFTASQVNQLSQEDPRWGGGHGVFTWYLLEGLRGGADEDGDRIVTLGETMEFVRDRVRRDTRNAQIPTISQTAFDWYLPMSLVREGEAAPQEGQAGGRPGVDSARDQPRNFMAQASPSNPADPGRPSPGAGGRPLPRVGVSVALRDAGRGDTAVLASLLTRRIQDQLREAGFPVSDMAGDTAAADVVLSATASISDQGEVMAGMRSAGLELSLSARERGNPAIIASSAGRASGAGLSLDAATQAAVERGALPAVDEISQALRGRWEGSEGAFSVILEISGLAGYGQIIWLKENLADLVPRSAGIVERSADLVAGTAELEWFTYAPSQDVARALEGFDANGIRLEVLRVIPGRIEVRVANREQVQE